jgi:hypothetical protein
MRPFFMVYRHFRHFGARTDGSLHEMNGHPPPARFAKIHPKEILP